MQLYHVIIFVIVNNALKKLKNVQFVRKKLKKFKKFLDDE